MPRTGWMILFVAAGGLGAGYALGRLHRDAPVARSAPEPPDDEPWWETDAEDEFAPEAEQPANPPPAAASAEEEPIPPSELLDTLRRLKDSPRSQQILVGMVADAARLGPRMLPEIQRLIESGEDIRFTAYDGQAKGYPTLRVALLAAAQATGDPAAAALIQEVAETTESPVEVVFSAHLLDRLDALDAPVAQRALDSLAGALTRDQKKALAPVVRQVVPAAARADPAYAENFLATQLRRTEEPRADPRLLAPILDGLPPERAGSFVLSTISAADVGEKPKMILAGRAAQQGELTMLDDLRRAIESNTLSPRISSSIARSALSNGPYSRMERDARRAVKKGNLAYAQKLAQEYQSRLVAADKTVQAARAAGARVPAELNTRATLYRQRLGSLLQQIRKAHEKQAAKGG